MEPKFHIGDVVEDTQNVGQSLSYPIYIIKESILVKDGDNPTGYNYKVAPINSHDESIIVTEDALSYQYHDTNWEKYFTESVGNGLPAWRGELYNWYVYDNDLENDGELENECTIPPMYMEHILEDHYIEEKMGNTINDNIDAVKRAINVNDSKEVTRIQKVLRGKIIKANLVDTDMHHPGKMARRAGIVFTSKEQKLVDIVCNIDRKDLFPFSTPYSQIMTSLQVMHAIKEAYETADKVSDTKGQIETDRRTGESHVPVKGQRVYRGKSETYNLLIEFWFDLDLKVITTAYPIKGE